MKLFAGVWFLLVVLAAMGRMAAAADVEYLRDIKPLLAKHCWACHGPLQQKHGLRLDTAAAVRRGGESGPTVVPSKADESLLLQAMTGQAGFKMPPEGDGTSLTNDEIDLVRRWIAAGAGGPADEQSQSDPRQYWSYQGAKRQPLPAILHPDWPADPIDTLIAANHDARGLRPQGPASSATWLRRAWLDLVGVAPPQEAVQAFVDDDVPDARSRVVDRLLAHPFHGQRWGRHWMDVWRYSDWYGSRGGNEMRYSQRHIWRWRDWIVDANNADKPYDRMIVEMLAGDELAPLDGDVLRATGFLGRNWYKFDRNVWMFDAVEHSAQAFLGLTIHCCRCHDHKYDPISQEDYYRFRAFFEPHDVRTDILAADVAMEKDATLGMVPKDGIARIFDKELNVPTFVFERGDNRYPDQKRPMSPGVPAALGGPPIDVRPVSLPAEAFYPALRPPLAASLMQKARAAIVAAEADVAKARQEAATAGQAADLRARQLADTQVQESVELPPTFRDDFSKARPDDWKSAGGQWSYENGRLVEKTVQSFATLVGQAHHPRDFRGKLRYRTLAPGTLRSIGISFDYVDPGNSQDIYTSTGDANQSLQAFHRLGGQQVYPQAGIVKTQLKVGDETTVEFAVRGSHLTLWLNGEVKLEYVLPVPRRDGRLALWAHDGSAEFLELEVRPLIATLADLRRAHQTSLAAVAMHVAKRATAIAELGSIEARLAAEKAVFGGADPTAASELAMAASRAERGVAVAKADEAVVAAEQLLATLRAARPNPPPEMPPAAEVDAQQKLSAAQSVRDAAQAVRDQPDGKYSPLGERFPATSTGRRLALARWIAHRDNPRTACIAVNHLWLRHFGQALVPSVANFGLNGDRPMDLALLDRLAVDLVDAEWSLKSLHRRMILSSTYGMESSAVGASAGDVTQDPENRFLWRMNSRRMEAEVVRDSLLFAADLMDHQFGGPEIPEDQGQSSPRRSLYFRLTPNEKMKFLELFDVADPNGCYRRRESVVPQQALALLNSPIALDATRRLAGQLSQSNGVATDRSTDDRFVDAAFRQLLGRPVSAGELAACQRFLADQAELARQPTGPVFPGAAASRIPVAAEPRQRAREDLIQVLFSHNDYVTIR